MNRAYDWTQVDESRESGRVSLGLSVIMRVTLKDGTYHEVYFLSPSRGNY